MKYKLSLTGTSACKEPPAFHLCACLKLPVENPPSAPMLKMTDCTCWVWVVCAFTTLLMLIANTTIAENFVKVFILLLF